MGAHVSFAFCPGTYIGAAAVAEARRRRGGGSGGYSEAPYGEGFGGETNAHMRWAFLALRGVRIICRRNHF